VVCILVFIHHNIAKFARAVAERITIGLQKPHGVEYHIVKIHSVGFHQPLLIYSVKLGYGFKAQIVPCLLLEFDGRYKLFLCVGYNRKHALVR